MGKNDIALSSYFSDPKIFADLFNAWMYGGKQVIDYRSLSTEDPVQSRPVRLHDMLAFPEGDTRIKTLVPDYPIHVISVRRNGSAGMDISLLHTELRQVFGFLQYQEDKEGLRRYVEENRGVFSRLSGNAALFLAASAHETRLLKGLNREEEHYDMCRALDEWYADGVNEGEKFGEKNGVYKGLSSALLRILGKKGSVPEKCLAYISSQKNMDRLNQLLDLAVDSETVVEFEKKAGI